MLREIIILTQRLQSVSIAKIAAFLQQFHKPLTFMLFRTQSQKEELLLF